MMKRRQFVSRTMMLAAGVTATSKTGWSRTDSTETDASIYLIGPQEGYAPEIGTLLSTMTMMRTWVTRTVQDLTRDQLDFQLDDKSNSIGAMLLHLAATERYYQLNTFEGLAWGTWSKAIKDEWDIPMNLGEEGRKHIKGHDIDYYLSKLESVREATKTEFAKREDEWLMQSESFFDNAPTNNYCKWFHVCEHESNHHGQIKFIIQRFA